MTRESFVFFAGFIVFLVPYLGLSKEWRQWLLVAVGALLMFIGYSLRRSAFLRSITEENGERRSDAFVEQVTPSLTTTKEEHIENT